MHALCATPITILVFTIWHYWCSTSYLSHRVNMYLPRDVKIKHKLILRYIHAHNFMSNKIINASNISFWRSFLNHSNVKYIREIKRFNTPLFHCLLLLVLTFFARALLPRISYITYYWIFHKLYWVQKLFMPINGMSISCIIDKCFLIGVIKYVFNQ